MVWIGVWAIAVPRAIAAEILSIRHATQLQIGDQNRSYGVELGCIAVEETHKEDALRWLQRHGPRGTKVNLRPIHEVDGLLVAQVRVLKSGLDLGDALVAAGLATPRPCLDSSPTPMKPS